MCAVMLEVGVIINLFNPNPKKLKPNLVPNPNFGCLIFLWEFYTGFLGILYAVQRNMVFDENIFVELNTPLHDHLNTLRSHMYYLFIYFAMYSNTIFKNIKNVES